MVLVVNGVAERFHAPCHESGVTDIVIHVQNMIRSLHTTCLCVHVAASRDQHRQWSDMRVSTLRIEEIKAAAMECEFVAFLVTPR